MKNLIYQQYDLQLGDTVQTVWLESGKIQVGNKITLKDSLDPNDWWTVIKEYNLKLEKAEMKDSHDSMKWHEKDHHTKLTGLKYEK